MRHTVGMLAAAMALLIALPGNTFAAQQHPKKYGLDFQIGGSYTMMEDVNNLIPHTSLNGIVPETEINAGGQFGLGIVYRAKDNFGWQFGYNRFFFLNNYRISTYLTSEESWSEQSVAGNEWYAIPTWYWDFWIGELFFGVGPGLYSATLDRSIDIVATPGTHLTAGGFDNAFGKALGLVGSVGLEITLGTNTGLTFQVGGRRAVVGKLKYYDVSGLEQVVWEDPLLKDVPETANYPKVAVDYTGAFAKVTLRTYFKPSSAWRTPKR